MKRRVTERVLVLILSIAVLLTSTGVYSAFATTDITSTSSTSATEYESTTAAQTETKQENTSAPASNDDDSQKPGGPNIVTEGGSVKADVLSGQGTAESPYVIANADDFFKMQDIVNNATKSDKHFVLDADINLAGVSYDRLKSNTVTQGTIVSAAKKLADTNPDKIWFDLNGNGHKIYGLNVKNTDLYGVSIFGYISAKSVIRNVKFENCSVEVASSLGVTNSVIALYNDGTIENCSFTGITLNVSKNDTCAYESKGVAWAFRIKASSGAVIGYNGGAVKNANVSNVKVNVESSRTGIGALVGVNAGEIASAALTGVNITVSDENKSYSIGAAAGINSAKISGCKVASFVIKNGVYAGGIAGTNSGTITDSIINGKAANTDKASESNSSFVGSGTFGAIAGFNSGKIELSTSASVGAYLKDNSVYGGIAGVCTGSVEKCVAYGSVDGGSATGGIIGKTVKNSDDKDTASVKNCYAFVKLTTGFEYGAIIGEGTADVQNNVWSDTVSGRYTAYASGIKDGNMAQPSRLIVLKKGESKKINKSALGSESADAAQTVDITKSFTLSGDGVKLTDDKDSFTVSASQQDKTAEIRYTARIAIKGGFGGSTVINQQAKITVLTLPEDAQGDGLTQQSAIKITNSAQLSMIKAAPYAHFALDADVDAQQGWQSFAFGGSFDGCGHTVKTGAPLFSAVYGTVQNLNVVLNDEIDTAVFGSSFGAHFGNVRLIKGEPVDEKTEVRLFAKSSVTGTFFNKVMGASVIDSCFTDVPVYTENKEISYIAGLIASLSSKNAVITSSGASTEITASFKDTIKNSAALIGGTWANTDGKISDCYATLSSANTHYALIGGGDNAVKAENCYYSAAKDVSAAPKDFKDVKANAWGFDAGEHGFIAGEGSVTAVTLPKTSYFESVTASDFAVQYDKNVMNVNLNGITVKDGVLYLPTQAADGNYTVINSKVVLISKTTLLRAEISLSNGLERDKNGNYLIAYGVDLAFLGENLDTLGGESFKVTKDLDMSELKAYEPIGNAALPFSGSFDGCGHTISGFKLNGTSNAALFGSVENAVIKNIIFDKAAVTAQGSYAAILAGQLVKSNKVSNITFNSCTVSAAEDHAAILAGYIGSDCAVNNISAVGGSVTAINSVGVIAGAVGENSSISAVKADGIKLFGANYIGGIAGKLGKGSSVSNAEVKSLAINAQNFVGALVGEATASVIADSSVDLAVITASQSVGGAAGAMSGEIKNVSISDSAVNADIAGGIIGETVADAKTSVTNCTVTKTKVNAQSKTSVSGGVVACVTANSELTVSSVKVSADSSVSAALAVGGIIGSVKGKANILNSSSFAQVLGSLVSSKAVPGTGGVIGKVGTEDFADVRISNVNVGGSVRAYENVGGVIGSVSSLAASDVSINKVITAASVVSDGKALGGLIIGSTGELKEEDITSAVKDVVLSSFMSKVGAYGSLKAEATYTDLDKAVSSSLKSAIDNGEEVAVSVKNDAAASLGFVFDSENGWRSASNDIISVVSSDENSVTLKALKGGAVSVVASYKYSQDSYVVLNVHFDVQSNIKTALLGLGTQSEPYKISSKSDLAAVAGYANDGAYFVLTNDIAFDPADFTFGGEFYNAGLGFMPIGSKDAAFNGTFDGAGHKISGVKINGSVVSAIFSYTDSAKITNLILDGITSNAPELSAVVAANAKNTEIKNVTVTNSSVEALSAKGSAAIIAAFADGCEIGDIKLSGSTVSAGLTGSEYASAYAGLICARAVNSKASGCEINSSNSISAIGTAGAVAGYAESLIINNVNTFAELNAVSAAALVGRVGGAINAKNCIAGGEVNASEYAAGIAAKADDAISASDICVSAALKGRVCGVAAAYADKNAYDDKNSVGASFENISYSSYQNAFGMFGDEEINAYQGAGYAENLKDVNTLVPSDGSSFIAVGAEPLNLSKALEYKGIGSDIASFDFAGAKFKLDSVESFPQGLVAYDAAAGTVTAEKTDIDSAKLLLKYTNGIVTAVDMVSVKGMTGSGTKENPFLINSEDTLKLLRVYPSANFVMTANVKLSEEWTPVPNFSGSFDGAFYNIDSLKVSSKNADAGLFAVLENAKIQNLSITNAAVKGAANAGVLAGSADGTAKISNVSISSSAVSAADYAGALVGSINCVGAEITDCTVTGSTIGADNAAGLAGIITGSAKINGAKINASTLSGVSAAGGITAVANANALTIGRCDVAAKISAKDAGSVAGVALSNLKINLCGTSSEIKGSHTEGGIIGFVNTEIGDGFAVTNCNINVILSGAAEHSAAIVAKFEPLPEDNEAFAAMFAGNSSNRKYDEFEPAVMQYQNFTPADSEKTAPDLPGSGTKEDPYKVSSAADIAKIPAASSAYYSLQNDIKLTAADYGISVDEDGNTVYGAFFGGYKPIKDFCGSFDGNGHVISGFYIDSDSDYVGLFANIKASGEVKNLHIELLAEEDGCGFFGIKGKNYVGGIAGYCESDTGLVNCSVTGGVITGERNVGGLVGSAAATKITNSFAVTTVKAKDFAGGLVGSAYGECEIENSFVSCDVYAVGGTIVGANNGSLSIKDVFSSGSSLGTVSVAIGENNGKIFAKSMIITGSNTNGAKSAIGADKAEYVYSDKTALGTSNKNVASLTTKELISSKPSGLDSWQFADGAYAVPATADDYSSAWAIKVSKPVGGKEAYEGNVAIDYSLTNETGDKSVDDMLVGVLISSGSDKGTVTSDLYTKANAKPAKLNALLVTSGTFKVSASLPYGYKYEVTAADENGKEYKVTEQAGGTSLVEIGSAEYVKLSIKIVKTDIPWGLTSLWESLSR